MGKKILIAYYSWSGNTDYIARMIGRQTGGDLFRIIPVEAYPEDYSSCTKQAKQEIRAGYKPEIKSGLQDLDGYDTIFIGSPNWWSTIAPPVLTFLTGNDLTGKQVLPFCTHGGGGEGHIFRDIKQNCLSSEVTEGLVLYGSGGRTAGQGITAWLEREGIELH